MVDAFWCNETFGSVHIGIILLGDSFCENDGTS
jgi:hypothetical protein